MFKVGSLAVAVAALISATSSAATAQSASDKSALWTGAYAGAQVGFGSSADDRTGVRNVGTNTFIGSFGDMNTNGAFGGVHLGYGWRVGAFIMGLEGDINLSGMDDKVSATQGAISVSTSSDIKWMSTLRGRVGVNPFDSVLVYGTIGLAFADVDYKMTIVNGANTARINNSEILNGATIGGGIEYAIDSRWRLRAEYQYTGFKIKEPEAALLTPAGAQTGTTYSTIESLLQQSVSVGLSYKF